MNTITCHYENWREHENQFLVMSWWRRNMRLEVLVTGIYLELWWHWWSASVEAQALMPAAWSVANRSEFMKPQIWGKAETLKLSTEADLEGVREGGRWPKDLLLGERRFLQQRLLLPNTIPIIQSL
jgi:hypothetical protein